METSEQIKLWSRQLKAIAQTGMEYGNDVFDKERYGQLNEISNMMLAYVSDKSIENINEILPIESGYATPKIAVRGLILKEGKLLMVKEAADGCWCLPGGWCDIGLTPGENIEKEIEEETGLAAKAKEIISFFDQTKYRASVTMQHIYTIYFLCEVTGGELRGSIETTDVAYFDINNLPMLSTERNTKEQLAKALAAAKQGNPIYFD